MQSKKNGRVYISHYSHAGLNRQIRRMCEACGYRVRELKRLRIMNIHLGGLPTGKYREITGEELSKLEKLAGRKPGGVYHG